MGFNFGKKDHQDANTTPFDEQAASTLIRILAQERRLLKPPSKKAWTRHISKLRSATSEQRIQVVLKWYETHIRDKYTPLVWSVTSFTKKFHQLEEAAARGFKTVDNSTLEITQKARDLSTRLTLLWPGDEKNLELQFIQISFTNYEKFRENLKTSLRELLVRTKSNPDLYRERLHNAIKHPKARRYAFYIRYLLEVERTEQYVAKWCREVHQIAHRWDGWRGDLLAWVLDTDSRIFRQDHEAHLRTVTGENANVVLRNIMDLPKGHWDSIFGPK
jgi:hypothetical protein